MIFLTIESLYEKTLERADPYHKRFLEYLHRDIRRFAESPLRNTGVLGFPKMHSVLRYLIQMVAELFSFSTLVIGNGEYRFTVVCNRRLALNRFHLKMMVIKYFDTHVIDPCYEPYEQCYDASTPQLVTMIDQDD